MPRDMSTIVPVGADVPGTTSVLDAPDGWIPMTDFLPDATGGDPNVVAAPPRTAREAVDTGRCSYNSVCKNRKKAGSPYCGSHYAKHLRELAANDDDTAGD